MKRLILVRHAPFDHSKRMETDLDHPLTRNGRQQAAAVAGQLAHLQIQPDLILVSPAKRARQTAEIVVKKMGLPATCLKVDNRIFEAEMREIFRMVHQFDDALETVMIIGHNPAMISLLQHLIESGVTKMDPASVAVLELSNNFWRRVAFGTVQLAHFITPGGGLPTGSLLERFASWCR